MMFSFPLSQPAERTERERERDPRVLLNPSILAGGKGLSAEHKGVSEVSLEATLIRAAAGGAS